MYETLLEAIVSGNLQGGEILSEVGVAEALNVSRTPVNVAFKELAKDGLIERPANRRATVIGFTPDDIYEIFELRKYLEGPAAELAAARIDERLLAPIREAIEELDATKGAPDWSMRWAEHDEAFHRDIATASGNKRLIADIVRYRLLHRSFNKLATDEKTLHRALEQHKRILSALEARDEARARKAMLAHITDFQKHFIRVLRREQAAKRA